MKIKGKMLSVIRYLAALSMFPIMMVGSLGAMNLAVRWALKQEFVRHEKVTLLSACVAIIGIYTLFLMKWFGPLYLKLFFILCPKKVLNEVDSALFGHDLIEAPSKPADDPAAPDSSAEAQRSSGSSGPA